jgi:acetolactate synthase-1/2/3 large subunit
VDIVGITRPCTKHNYLVNDVRELAKVLRQAFFLARSGRPGPVLVDLPKDVLQGSTEFIWPDEVRMRSYNPTYRPNLNQLRRAADALIEAKRPLLFAGGGVITSNAAQELRTLAHALHIPVTSTLMGLGAFPGDDPLWLGMVGMHGTFAANKAMSNTDLLIAVGARFDDRVTGRLSGFAPGAAIVHIDIDPTSIRKNVDVAIPVVGDCKRALGDLAEILSSRMAEKDWHFIHGDWLAAVAGWNAMHPLTYKKSEKIKPQVVIRKVCELTEGKAIISTEVGQNQMWTAQFYTVREPRTLLTSGGLGTMGYGLPAAIGAQIAFPDALVIDFAGDGSIQMNIQEMATAVANNLPVKIIILNNMYLGMVRQWQELFYERNYSCTVMENQPDFVKLAEAYGAEGYRITRHEELEPVLRTALASPATAIVDVHIAREENVYPMVPAGASLEEMLFV